MDDTQSTAARVRSGPYVLTALIILAFIGLMLARGEFALSSYKAFYCGGRMVLEGHNPYLVEPLRSCEHAIVSTPSFPSFAVEPAPMPTYTLAIFALIALLPVHASYALFIALLSLSLLVFAWSMTQITGYSPVLLVLVSLPIWAMTLGFSDVPPIAVAAIALCGLALQREHYTVAAIFACVAMLQPHLALPLCIALFIWVPKVRFPLIVGAAVLATIGILVAGIHTTLAYYTTFLPLQAASEITATDQYSLTHVLYVLGVGSGLALRLGSLWYVLMVALGVFAARRLATDLRTPALIAFAPPAFALLGGTYVHDIQMFAALPLVLTLLPRAQVMRPALIAAAVLVCVPWTQPDSRLMIVSIFVAVTALGVIIFTAQPARFAKALALALLVTLAVLAVNRLPGAPRTITVSASSLAIAPTAPASQAWSALIRSSPFWSVPSPLSEGRKIPTWFGLALLLVVSLRKQRRYVPLPSVPISAAANT